MRKTYSIILSFLFTFSLMASENIPLQQAIDSIVTKIRNGDRSYKNLTIDFDEGYSKQNSVLLGATVSDFLIILENDPAEEYSCFFGCVNKWTKENYKCDRNQYSTSLQCSENFKQKLEGIQYQFSPCREKEGLEIRKCIRDLCSIC